MTGFKIEVPNDYFARSAAREYADDAGLALVREFVQNSCDAKAKNVEFVFHAGNELVVTDDGKGADAKTIRERILTPLESFKDEGAVGGFGKAKELLFFANSKWKIRTRDVEVVGSYLDVQSFTTGLENAPGFLVRVTLPEGLYKAARSNVRRFLESSERPGVKWLLDGDEVTTDVKRAKKCAKDFGFAKAYVQRDCADTGVYLRTGGLLTNRRYGYQPQQVGRVVIEVTAASVDVLTPARDWFRMSEHRHQVEAWLNELVVNYEKALADDVGDEVVFVDDEHVEAVTTGNVVSSSILPATNGIIADVTFHKTAGAAPTPEEQKAEDELDMEAIRNNDPAALDALAAALSSAVEVSAKAAPPAPVKSAQGFDMGLMPKVDGIKRVTVHTGGKAQAKKGAAWLKKNKHEAAILLAAWTTAVRVVAAANQTPIDSVGFTFCDSAEAEFLKAKNGRWAVLINPLKANPSDYYFADELLDCAIHELAHQLRGASHDALWASYEAKVRRSSRNPGIRGAVARSLLTHAVEEAL
jgi:hypothetical protein